MSLTARRRAAQTRRRKVQHPLCKFCLERGTGSRVLDEHYGSNLLGLAVAKGPAARLAYISEFIEQAKASGLVQQAIERAGLPGYKVASSKTN